MTLNFFEQLATAGCLVLLVAGCDDSTAGAGGTGGAGGTTGGAASQLPGLWDGQVHGVDVCFYISDDGLRLIPNVMCNVTGQGEPDAVPRSFDLGVDGVGTDENGEPCSFELSFTRAIAIDQATHSFRASEIRGGVEVAFSGEVTGGRASGVARRDSGGAVCRVGWATTKSAQCDDAAIQSCLDLLDCCRATLVSPVFFQSCNSVVQQCDQTQCLQALAGYPQCATVLGADAGIPDGG